LIVNDFLTYEIITFTHANPEKDDATHFDFIAFTAKALILVKKYL